MSAVNALAFASAGFEIIPVQVRCNGNRWHKMPMAKWKDATTKKAVIASWWSDWPDALPAIPLEKVNWAVVDADRREGVDGVAQATDLGPLGPHSRITTPSGGLHLVFAQPPEPITKLSWCDGVEILGTSCLLTCYDLEELKFPHVAPRAVLPEIFRKPRKLIGGNLKIKGTKEALISRAEGDTWVADLTSALRQMDARDWRGAYEEWLGLATACAYVGITRDDFVAWSVSDPYYASDGELIRRIWRSLKPTHGGALMAALKARGIKTKRAERALILEVPPTEPELEPKPKSSGPNLRRATGRIESAISAIDRDPTERCLFWAACLCAEIVHECKLKPSHIVNLIAGNAYPTLHKTLGKEGIRRTISNAFRHVEEKYLAEPTAGGKTA